MSPKSVFSSLANELLLRNFMVEFSKNISLRSKLLLIALVPLATVSAVMIWVFTSQSNALLEAEIATIRKEFMVEKKQELRNYTLLALNSVRDVYENEIGGVEAAQQQVIKQIETMEFGKDGYFFIYAEDGTNIMHPRLRDIVGTNLWDMQDTNGDYVIRNLITKAQQKPSGDFHNYVWPKPSTDQIAAKLGYSIYLKNWDWMIGTGLYLDDIDKQVASIREQINANIGRTNRVLIAVTVIAMSLVTFALLIVRLSEQRFADQKLRQLTRRIVDVQEEERKRVSQELHDSISQLLISARYTLDSADSKSKTLKNVRSLHSKIGTVLDNAINEVRRISKDLRPSVLDDIGLASAVYDLGDEFAASTGIKVNIDAEKGGDRIHPDIRTTLYRVIQEAMTNVVKHAKASKLEIELKYNANFVNLKIRDDGIGFNRNEITRVAGFGVRNMRERVETYHGTLEISSNSNKELNDGWSTEIVVCIPLERNNTKKQRMAAA